MSLQESPLPCKMPVLLINKVYGMLLLTTMETALAEHLL